MAVLLLGATANAVPPERTRYADLPADYIVTGAESGCGFDIHIVGVDKVSITDYFDKQGNFVREVFHDDFVGTESANGVTLNSSEHATITDYADGSEKWTGQPMKVTLPSGKQVTKDVGKLVYDSDGNLAVVHGPHPYTQGDIADYCAAFTA
jgi:hypothetical protein